MIRSSHEIQKNTRFWVQFLLRIIKKKLDNIIVFLNFLILIKRGKFNVIRFKIPVDIIQYIIVSKNQHLNAPISEGKHQHDNPACSTFSTLLTPLSFAVPRPSFTILFVSLALLLLFYLQIFCGTLIFATWKISPP